MTEEILVGDVIGEFIVLIVEEQGRHDGATGFVHLIGTAIDIRYQRIAK